MRAADARPALLAALALALAVDVACKSKEVQIEIVVPPLNGRVCSTYTDLACVNYLEFTVIGQTTSSSHCVVVPMGALGNLCDVAALAEGRELFSLPPETPLPIEVRGKRVFPAETCGTRQCDKTVFVGQTGSGRIGDYVDRPLELTLSMAGACGQSEEFFTLPDGGTCVDVCGGQSNIICDGVAGGCVCKSRMDGGQGGID
jgi:hypothetical protein